MKKKLLHVVRSGLPVLFVMGLADAPAAPPTVTCEFSNPGYSGRCRVTKRVPAGNRPRQFCSQVLACLNDARCVRTYCNATTIRGGWKIEKVETAPKTP
jgi:hypothetical protein